MSAPVALLEVTAQDRGAAVANVSQRSPLLAGQHRVPASQEILLMSAEDIGQFQPMLFHRGAHGADADLGESRHRCVDATGGRDGWLCFSPR
jgi:hypothetical protein